MSDMFGKVVHEKEFGPFSYQIKSPKRGRFTLWLGGCRIGKPKENGDVWEFTAKALAEAKEEMRQSAMRELRKRMMNLEKELADLTEVFDAARSV